MTRLAVFGAGRIGAVHALNAAAIEGVQIAHLVDPVADCDALAARLGARRSTATEALADASLDGIVIASSTDTPPLAGIRDGYEARRLAEAAIVSIGTGQPVQLSPGWKP